MITTTRLFIKEHFPHTYELIRKWLFPMVSQARTMKQSAFMSPVLFSATPLGTSFSIELDPQNGFIDQHIFATGTYEPDILILIKRFLKPGDTFIDIGGNIGWHTLFAASLVGETGHVHTFEPIPRLAKQLHRSIAANDFKNRITLHEHGCSDQPGSAEIKLNQINIGGSSLFGDMTEGATIVIPLKPADATLLTLQAIALIKIDTEGSELEVLKGIRESIKKFKPTLLIEYSPSFWGTNRAERSDAFFQILLELNYQIFDLEDGHRTIPDPFTWSRSFTKLQTNILCLPS